MILAKILSTPSVILRAPAIRDLAARFDWRSLATFRKTDMSNAVAVSDQDDRS